MLKDAQPIKQAVTQLALEAIQASTKTQCKAGVVRALPRVTAPSTVCSQHDCRRGMLIAHQCVAALRCSADHTTSLTLNPAPCHPEWAVPELVMGASRGGQREGHAGSFGPETGPKAAPEHPKRQGPGAGVRLWSSCGRPGSRSEDPCCQAAPAPAHHAALRPLRQAPPPARAARRKVPEASAGCLAEPVARRRRLWRRRGVGAGVCRVIEWVCR